MSNDENVELTPEQTSFNEVTEPFAEPTVEEGYDPDNLSDPVHPDYQGDLTGTDKCCGGYPQPGYDLPRDRALVEMFKVGKDSNERTLEVLGIAGVPHIATKDDWVVANAEELLPVPSRQKGCIGNFSDHSSFSRHFSEQKNTASRIYFDPLASPVKATAVFDENQNADNPRWRKQFSVLTLHLDDEWKEWQALVNKKDGISQRDLAEFLDDHSRSISTEYRDHIIESTKFFTTTKQVVYSGATDLDTGDTQFTFNEVTQVAGAGKGGTVEVPKEFKIEIAVFRGGAAYSLPCKLRYRVTSDGIRFFVRVPNIQKAFDLAVGEIMDSIEAQTGVKPFVGNA